MDLQEKTLKENEVFHGHLLHMFNDEVELPNGDISHREVVRHPGGATVCAITEDMEIALVRQYRYPYGEEILELPAGKLEPGEDPAEAARRELKEETGLIADELLPLGTIYPSPGYTDEIIYAYLSIGAKQGEQQLDTDEFVNVVYIPVDKALGMVVENELPDAKSQIAILKAYIIVTTFAESVKQAAMAAEAE